MAPVKFKCKFGGLFWNVLNLNVVTYFHGND